MTAMATAPPTSGRFVDIVFSQAAQEDLTGADAEFLAAVALAYYEPHSTAPTMVSGRQTWRVRDTIALVVEDDGVVTRVTERELPDPDDMTPPPLPSKPAGRRVRGHKGGTNLPTDSVEFLARCTAAGLKVVETNTGTHWKITDPSGRRNGAVFISSTTNPSEIKESVGHVRRRLGVDVRKYDRNGPVSRAVHRNSGRRRADGPGAYNIPPKLVLTTGPTRAQARAAGWTRDPDPTPDEEVAAMLATADPTTTDAADIAAADTTEPASTEPEAEAPGEPAGLSDMERALNLARLAVVSRTMSGFDKNRAILRYVKIAREHGQTDAVTAGKLGVKPNGLGARLTMARRDRHPDALPTMKKFTDPRTGIVTEPGQTEWKGQSRNGAKRTVTADPKAEPRTHTRTVTTRPETAANVEAWLADHGEPVTEPAPAVEDVPAVAPARPVPASRRGLTEPTEIPFEAERDDLDTMLDEVAASPEAAAAFAAAQDVADDEPEPTEETLDAAITEAAAAWPDDADTDAAVLREEDDTADPADTEDDGSAYGSLSERGLLVLDELGTSVERVIPAADVSVEDVPEPVEDTRPSEHGTIGDVLAGLATLRADLAPQAYSPFEVFMAALREAGVQITGQQLTRARGTLRDFGWTLRMDGKV